MRKILLDTSSELIVERFNQGVKLISPNSRINSDANSVSTIMQLPLNVYFINTESVIQNINEHTIKTSGYLSVNDSIGKTVKVAAKKEAAAFSLAHDALVLRTNKTQIAFESFIRKVDNVAFSAMSIKYPWYNEDNQLIGVFGCSLIPKEDDPFSLIKPLSLLLQLDLLDKNHLNHPFLPKNVLPNTNCLNSKDMSPQLTKRQEECLFYLVQGMTNKQIAKCLALSPRTVEHYLEHIKKKLNAHSRIDLVAKVLAMNLVPGIQS